MINKNYVVFFIYSPALFKAVKHIAHRYIHVCRYYTSAREGTKSGLNQFFTNRLRTSRSKR